MDARGAVVVDANASVTVREDIAPHSGTKALTPICPDYASGTMLRLQVFRQGYGSKLAVIGLGLLAPEMRMVGGEPSFFLHP